VLLVCCVGDGGRVKRNGACLPRPNTVVVGQEVFVVGSHVVFSVGELEDVSGVAWVSPVGGGRIATDGVLSRTNIIDVRDLVAIDSRSV